MKFSIYVIWFFLLSITNVSAEKTPEELSSTCLGCHGVVSYNNIYPTYKVPKLGNQHKDYLVAALKAYRSGERTHLTMRAHASNLSDSDIVKIAEYFSSIKYQEQVTGNAWSTGNSMNTARAQLAGAGTQTAALGFGGTTPPVSALTEQYNGTSWTEVADLNTARASVG